MNKMSPVVLPACNNFESITEIFIFVIMNQASKTSYLNEIKHRISKEMPRVIEEIKIYENKLRNGQLNQKPKSVPQFNG